MFLRTPTFRSGGLKLSLTNTTKAALIKHDFEPVSYGNWFLIWTGDVYMKRLIVTGYKQHELGIFDEKHPGITYIKKAIENQLLPLIDEGLEWVIISGQLGVEIWTAELIIDLKKRNFPIKYAVITPFLDQEKRWNEHNQEKYQSIIANTDFYTTVTKKPYEAPWQFIEKNKFLIRNADGLLLIYDEENEGSPKYIKELAEHYAEKHDFEIFIINGYDLQVIAEEEQANQDFY